MRAMRTLLVVGLLSVTVVRAFASQVVPMSIEQLADHSGEVIVGTVANVTSQWRENPRRIESLVTFEGVSLLKGDRTLPDNMFTLTVPGGSVGEFQMRVCCAPEFAVGDKWVLMLIRACFGPSSNIRNLGDVKWVATEDGSVGKGTGRHIACFILDPL